MRSSRDNPAGQVQGSRSRELPLPLLLGATAVLLHAAVAAFTPYGIFRDELYYIACSKRLAFGYVDHPPLSIFTLFAARHLLGESVFAIRLVPALFSGATIWLTGSIALRLGGGLFAVLIACLAAMLAPIGMAMHSVYSMNALDHFFWTLGAMILLRLLDSGGDGAGAPASAEQKRWWLLLGLVIGLGSLNKIGMLWFAAGVSAGVLLSPLRRQLRTPWPWAAAGLAAVLFLPFVIWNVANDFAHLEFIRNATAMKYGGVTRTDFLLEQTLLQNPIAAPLWIAGLLYLFRARGGRLRPLAMLYVVPFLILIANGHSKGEYLAPAYYLLFAAGGVSFEALTLSRLRGIRYVALALLVATAILLAPLATPLLPVEQFIAYNSAIMPPPRSNEGHELTGLPQFFADMHGWEDLAKTVSRVYLSLPEAERRSAVVFARNYGQAGALEYFADRYSVPRVIAVHNSYWLWGHPPRIGTVIVIGGDEETHRSSCAEVIEAAEFHSPHAMPYENNSKIWICRGLHRAIEEIWKTEKHYI